MITDRLLAAFPPFDPGRLVNMVVSGGFTLLGVWLGARLALKGQRRRARRDIELAYAREVAATAPALITLIDDVQCEVDLANQGVSTWLHSSMASHLHGKLDALEALAHRASAEAGHAVLSEAAEVERLARHAALIDRLDHDQDMLPEPDPRLPRRLVDALTLLRTHLESLREIAVMELRDEAS